MAKYAKKNTKKKKKYLDTIQIVTAYIFIIIVAVMMTFLCQRVKYEKQIAEINAIHEEELYTVRTELQKDYESRVAKLEQYYEYGGDVTQIELEAEYIARVIYGTARNHAESDKRAVVWCILNRVEHYAHPNTVAEVCKQPKQWMGYSNDNPVLTENYDLALEELKIWHGDGHRPVGNEYIYLSWSSKEILLRDTFEENKNTHYWRMR
jgi:hypothetical protein